MTSPSSQKGRDPSHFTEWEGQETLPESRSASNAAGQLVDHTWAPVKNVVSDTAKICMGERPGSNAVGSTGTPDVSHGPNKPDMQQVIPF